PPGAASARLAPPEQLARGLALALADPAFRARVHAELDRSPYREHKLPFQRFLAADGGVALAALARRTGRPASDLAREADAAIPPPSSSVSSLAGGAGGAGAAVSRLRRRRPVCT